MTIKKWFVNQSGMFACFAYQKPFDGEYLKGQVQCFSIQVVMNMCFLLSPEKNLVQISLAIFRVKGKNRLPPTHSNSEKK